MIEKYKTDRLISIFTYISNSKLYVYLVWVCSIQLIDVDEEQKEDKTWVHKELE